MPGHYDVGFILRTYAHATRQKQDEAANTMGRFMAWRRSCAQKEEKHRAGRANFLTGAISHDWVTVWFKG